MSFYTSIHEYYDLIFPLNRLQVNFVERELPASSKILDIGCATGSLAIELAKMGYQVTATDLDASMIQAANAKAQLPNLIFMRGNMLKLDHDFPESFFDGLLCFGNTLAHLAKKELLLHFFESASKVLMPGGKLLVQLLNYEYILKEKIASLPVIENDQIKFERQYDFLKNGLINFKTTLTVKSSGQRIQNEVPLMPFVKNEILEMLSASGFKSIELYGSFTKEALQASHIPFIFKAKK